MGVKSTVALTREEALNRIVSIASTRMHKALESDFSVLTSHELENVLEDMNDTESGGEGFENYSISN